MVLVLGGILRAMEAEPTGVILTEALYSIGDTECATMENIHYNTVIICPEGELFDNITDIWHKIEQKDTCSLSFQPIEIPINTKPVKVNLYIRGYTQKKVYCTCDVRSENKKFGYESNLQSPESVIDCVRSCINKIKNSQASLPSNMTALETVPESESEGQPAFTATPTSSDEQSPGDDEEEVD